MRTLAAIVATFAALAVLAWVIWQNLVPSGVFVAHYRPGEPSALIGPLVPESRLLPLRIADDGTPYRSIVEEPINFDVRMPLSFDSATVRVTFGGDARLLEIGGLASRESWTYDLRPAGNAVLDELVGWHTVTEGQVTLYERTARYRSLAEFFADIPPSGVASYRATIGSSARIPGYAPSEERRRYAAAFRGGTTIKAYLEREPLDFAFLVQDVNRHEGPDVLRMVASRLSDGASALAGVDVEIAQVVSADDGSSAADGRHSAAHWVRITTPEPVSGVVRLELRAGDDIVFRETETPHRKFVFANRFYSADHVGYLPEPVPLRVVTNGRRLAATTAHPEAFQTVTAGSGEFTVDDLNARFTASVASDIRRDGYAEVRAPYGDLRLETAGVFAFGRENLFNPDPVALTGETDVDADGIDFILTSYVPPARRGEWKTAEATFDLRGLSVRDRAANFTLSVPGMELDQAELRIAGIEVELHRPSLDILKWKDAVAKLWRTLTGREQEFVNGLIN